MNYLIRPDKWRWERLLPCALLLTLLLSLAPTQLFAAALQAPDACPGVGGFDGTVERTDFCVYYQTSITTNAQATTLAVDSIIEAGRADLIGNSDAATEHIHRLAAALARGSAGGAVALDQPGAEGGQLIAHLGRIEHLQAEAVPGQLGSGAAGRPERE